MYILSSSERLRVKSPREYIHGDIILYPYPLNFVTIQTPQLLQQFTSDGLHDVRIGDKTKRPTTSASSIHPMKMTKKR